MLEVTKADVILWAANQLIKLLQVEIPANNGKHDSMQLTWLVNIFHNTATKTRNQCAEQQSNRIRLNKEQPRAVEISQNISHQTKPDREVQQMVTQESNQQQRTNVHKNPHTRHIQAMPRRLLHQP